MIFDLKASTDMDAMHKCLQAFGSIDKTPILQKNTKKNDGTFVAKINFTELNKKDELVIYLNKQYTNWYSPNVRKTSQANEKPISRIPETQNTQNTFQNPSLHYYHKAYGKDIEEFQLTHNYQELFDIKSASNDEKFQLTTLYPGLLVGSGYNHPKLKDNHDFQLGFFFDHTTGLPIISGSSIKGVVRSLFTDEKFEYLKSVYDVKETKEVLEKRLFLDGSTIFYDAYIIATHKENKGKIFASDYITSHHSDDPMGQFKEPNPVKFLKVLSGVTFQFQFKGRKEDIALIQAIILDFGVGAKTNVGYGQFE